MKQFINVGGLTGELDFGMVLFLTQHIGTPGFMNDQFEFKGKESKGFSFDVFKATHAGMKSHYGVI